MDNITHVYDIYNDAVGTPKWIVSQYKHTRRQCSCKGMYGICNMTTIGPSIKCVVLDQKEALVLCDLDRNRCVEKIYNIRIKNIEGPGYIHGVPYQKVKFADNSEPEWVISACIPGNKPRKRRRKN